MKIGIIVLSLYYFQSSLLYIHDRYQLDDLLDAITYLVYYSSHNNATKMRMSTIMNLAQYSSQLTHKYLSMCTQTET